MERTGYPLVDAVTCKYCLSSLLHPRSLARAYLLDVVGMERDWNEVALDLLARLSYGTSKCGIVVVLTRIPADTVVDGNCSTSTLPHYHRVGQVFVFRNIRL